ncbi:MAG: hypothetical protein ACI9Y1_003193, partial [Lentisphaeria bacterium]
RAKWHHSLCPRAYKLELIFCVSLVEFAQKKASKYEVFLTVKMS